jgi:hypothetical protein
MNKWIARFPIIAFYAGSLGSYIVARWMFIANDCLSIWRWGNFVCEVSETQMHTAKSHLMSKTLGALATAMSLLTSSTGSKFLQNHSQTPLRSTNPSIAAS